MKTNELSATSIVEALINSQGKKVKGKAKSGVSGQMFESVVHALGAIGFEILSFERFEQLQLNGKLPYRYIVRNKPYQNLLSRYKKKSKRTMPRTEFVIYASDANSTKEFPLLHGSHLEIRIECKWQGSAGTTSDKLPMTVMNLQCCPEKNVIILMDGPEFNDAWHSLVQELCEDGITWKRAPDLKQKAMKKMRIEEFINWANRAFG